MQPLETQLAGHRDFDYLYGQTALQAQQATVAALAFERCLAVNPRDGLCRLGMARAHIALQEESRARQEIHYLQQSNPPKAVQQAINNYRDLLAGIQGYKQDSRLAAYVQWGVGLQYYLYAHASLQQFNYRWLCGFGTYCRQTSIYYQSPITKLPFRCS